MNARHSHRWLAWLLPLFLLRALVPAGFMLSWSEQGLQIVMCSGSGPMTLPGDVAADAEQHHAGPHQGAPHQEGQHEHSQADNATMCPFAAAGTSGVLPSFEAAVAFVATVSQEVRGLPDLDLPAAAVLIDRIRGPPLA
jgi:hypothetical protein